MSVAVSTICWRVQLPASEKLVLLCLADFADDDGICWPAVELIQERTGLTDRTIRENLKKLESAALIEREKRVGQSARYRITVAGVSLEKAPEPVLEEATEAPSDRKNLPVEVEKFSSRTGKIFQSDRKNFPVEPEKFSSSYRTITEPPPTRHRTTKRAGARDPVPVPDWLNLDAWSAFVESRRRHRAPFTECAATLILAKLDQLRADGQDPTACLLQSVERGWRGVFPVKPSGGRHEGDFRAARKPSLVERVAAACDEWEASFDILEADDRALRPQVDERPGRGAESNVVEGNFRAIG